MISFLFKIERDGSIASFRSYERPYRILSRHVEKLSTTRGVTALKPARGGNTPFITVQSDRDIISAIYSDVAADWSKPTHRRLICISARLIVNGPPRPLRRASPPSSAYGCSPSVNTSTIATTIEIDIIGSARYRWTTVLPSLTSLCEVLARFRVAKITRKISRNDPFNCCLSNVCARSIRFYL